MDASLIKVHGAVVGFGKSFHDDVPDASRSPTNEAAAAGRVAPKALRQIAPLCARTQYQKNAVGETPVVGAI
jgi:hypothetical protein